MDRVADLPVHDEVRAALDNVILRARRAGHDVRPREMLDVSWRNAWKSWQILIGEDTLGGSAALMRGALRSFAHPRESMLTRALEMRRQTGAQLDHILAEHHALITPATLVPAFTHRPTGSAIHVGTEVCDYWLAAAATTCLASLTGHPALVMPVGLTASGLPLAIQLIGRRFHDSELLNMAESLEAMLDPFPRPPAPRG
jgi:amidase